MIEFEGADGVRLGKKGQGFRAMLDLMNNARLGVAAQALGVAEAALHDAASTPRSACSSASRSSSSRWCKSMLTLMAINTEAVRALLYRTYALID